MPDLKRLCEETHAANVGLPKNGLVTTHSGNASGRDPESGLVAIKPSGVDYDKLTPDMLVVVDQEGHVVRGNLKPSVDLPHHLYLYRHMPEINGIVHTHSPYATSFAALQMSIPCYLTAVADEFGGEIPCAPYVDNLENHIGEAILKYRTRAPAILLGNHGAFCYGESPAAALKAAIMLEDVARTIHHALTLGKPKVLPPEEVQKWWGRYHSWYGQGEKGNC